MGRTGLQSSVEYSESVSEYGDSATQLRAEMFSFLERYRGDYLTIALFASDYKRLRDHGFKFEEEFPGQAVFDRVNRRIHCDGGVIDLIAFSDEHFRSRLRYAACGVDGISSLIPNSVLGRIYKFVKPPRYVDASYWIARGTAERFFTRL